MDDNIIVFLVALLMIGGGGYLLHRQKEAVKARAAYAVEATVVKILSDTQTESSDNGPSRTVTYYFPVYEYTIDGTEYRQKSPVGRSHISVEVGQKVMVNYNPDNPRKVYTKADATSNYVFYGIVVAMGVVLLFSAFFLF